MSYVVIEHWNRDETMCFESVAFVKTGWLLPLDFTKRFYEPEVVQRVKRVDGRHGQHGQNRQEDPTFHGWHLKF